MRAVADHADRLASELVARVAPLGWAPFRALDSSASAAHLLSLRHPNHTAVEVQRLLAEAGVVVSPRGGGIRVSLHYYNDSGDITAFVDALARLG